MEITTRNDRTTVTLVLQTVIRPFMPLLVKSTFKSPNHPVQCSPSRKAKSRCHVSERQVEGLYVYDLRSKKDNTRHHDKTKSAARRHIFYFAGGGWKLPPSGQHWSLCTEVACSLPDTTVTVVSYPLAPTYHASTAFPMLYKWYATAARLATEANEKVILAGDSSGGNIAICLALYAVKSSGKDSKDSGIEPLPQPAAVLGICPTVDLSVLSDESHAEAVRRDPILTLKIHNAMTKSWCRDSDPTEAHISPSYADLDTLVACDIRLFVVTAGYDILTRDALLFRDKCQRAGVKGRWLEWDKQMHVFPLIFSYRFPECVQAKNWMLDCLKSL